MSTTPDVHVISLHDMVTEDPPTEGGFITVDTPTDFPTPDENAMTCVVCGTDVSHLYKRRVKEPRCEEHKKSGGASKLGTSKGRSSSKDVDAAVSSLDMAYNLLEMGLMFAGAHQSMNLLRRSIEGDEGRKGLREQNRDYLSQDPELARRIASIGKTGGRYAFFAAQIATLGPVAILAFSEVSARRADARTETPQEWSDDLPGTVGGVPVD